jgi:glycosyltransferase involved in cell wall biosynthesis
VHRSLNLVKHLREFGYEPIVLTIDEKSIDKAGYTKDQTLLNELPVGAVIKRMPSHEPVKLIKVLMKLRIYRLFWFFFFPFLWEWSFLWSLHAIKVAKQIIIDEKIDIVYTSSGPFSSLVTGYILKKKLGIKWVADLRDPYTDAYAWDFPSKFHWQLTRKIEARVLAKPDFLIVNTNAVKRLYIKRGLRNGKEIAVVNNGY